MARRVEDPAAFPANQPEKLAQGKRVRGAPGDRALGIQTFEVADQQLKFWRA